MSSDNSNVFSNDVSGIATRAMRKRRLESLNQQENPDQISISNDQQNLLENQANSDSDIADSEFEEWAVEEENESIILDSDQEFLLALEESAHLFEDGVGDGDDDAADVEIPDGLNILTENHGRIDIENFISTGPWTNEPLVLNPVNDIHEISGAINIPEDVQTPYDFFKLLFTEEMLESICRFTNSYAQLLEIISRIHAI
jgi:hypothetical protein